jgi:cob(I)alamin adenosyltransferase
MKKVVQNVTNVVLAPANHIYTRNGDKGFTSLYMQPKKVAKSSEVFDALGNLDELNAFIGLAISSKVSKIINKNLLNIQCDLLEIGSYVAGKSFIKEAEKRWQQKILDMESLIDELEKKNKPLKNFITPGGSVGASQLHVSRAICRRSERSFVKYMSARAKKPKLKILITYLNRLSDLLFVMARYENRVKKVKDNIWKPAKV